MEVYVAHRRCTVKLRGENGVFSVLSFQVAGSAWLILRGPECRENGLPKLYQDMLWKAQVQRCAGLTVFAVGLHHLPSQIGHHTYPSFFPRV